MVSAMISNILTINSASTLVMQYDSCKPVGFHRSTYFALDSFMLRVLMRVRCSLTFG